MDIPPPPEPPSSNPGDPFPRTHWSVILAAGDSQSPEAVAARDAFCRDYYPPVRAYFARAFHDPDRADDLTQGFFQQLFAKHWLKDVRRERGKFRAFLTTCVKRYAANAAARDRAQKRGGHGENVPLDELENGSYEPLQLVESDSAVAAFDRAWAEGIVARAIARLRAESAANGQRDLFAALKCYLQGGGPPQADTATRLGLELSNVKSSIHRLRQRYGDLLRAEVAKTVPWEDVEEELRYLLEIMFR